MEHVGALSRWPSVSARTDSNADQVISVVNADEIQLHITQNRDDVLCDCGLAYRQEKERVDDFFFGRCSYHKTEGGH